MITPWATPAAPAADATRPAKLGLCMACHGEDGRGRTPDAPHIGGQSERYLAHALTQYRNGGRQDAAMRAIAGTLGPSDIESLARWYAAQRWPAGDTTEQER